MQLIKNTVMLSEVFLGIWNHGMMCV